MGRWQAVWNVAQAVERIVVCLRHTELLKVMDVSTKVLCKLGRVAALHLLLLRRATLVRWVLTMHCILGKTSAGKHRDDSHMRCLALKTR